VGSHLRSVRTHVFSTTTMSDIPSLLLGCRRSSASPRLAVPVQMLPIDGTVSDKCRWDVTGLAWSTNEDDSGPKSKAALQSH
jgi:hypothetical protein